MRSISIPCSCDMIIDNLYFASFHQLTSYCCLTENCTKYFRPELFRSEFLAIPVNHRNTIYATVLKFEKENEISPIGYPTLALLSLALLVSIVLIVLLCPIPFKWSYENSCNVKLKCRLSCCQDID